MLAFPSTLLLLKPPTFNNTPHTPPVCPTSGLHPGVFTYKGTCTRAGELIVKNPEKKAEKSRESAATSKATAKAIAKANAKAKVKANAKATAARVAPVAVAAAAKESAQDGKKSPLARARSRLAARVTRKAPLSARGEKSGGEGSHGKGGGDAPPDPPKEQPMTFKRIISGAVEEGLGLYENGARLQILLGLLLNLPWVLVLWFGRGSNTAYVAD